MLAAPLFERFRTILHISGGNIPFRIFQSIRTFILVLIGYFFDIAPSLAAAFDMMKRSIADLRPSYFIHNELNLLYGDVSDEQMVLDYSILLITTVFYFFVSLYQEIAKKELRSILDKKSVVIQWGLLFVTTLFVLSFGKYGPGYDIQGFLYMQF